MLEKVSEFSTWYSRLTLFASWTRGEDDLQPSSRSKIGERVADSLVQSSTDDLKTARIELPQNGRNVFEPDRLNHAKCKMPPKSRRCASIPRWAASITSYYMLSTISALSRRPFSNTALERNQLTFLTVCQVPEQTLNPKKRSILDSKAHQ